MRTSASRCTARQRSWRADVSNERYTAYRYRQHADELRTIAAAKKLGADRATLLKLADEYEAMARTMEAVDKTNEAMRKAKVL
jgi:hypothetical protein